MILMVLKHKFQKKIQDLGKAGKTVDLPGIWILQNFEGGPAQNLRLRP